jgi:hypothetical protein
MCLYSFIHHQYTLNIGNEAMLTLAGNRDIQFDNHVWGKETVQDGSRFSDMRISFEVRTLHAGVCVVVEGEQPGLLPILRAGNK